MVEDNVDHAEHAVLLLDLLELLLHLLLLVGRLAFELLREQIIRVLELVVNRVRRVALAALLEGRVMDHVVTAVSHRCEVRRPLLEGSHPLGDDRLDDETVEG